MRDNTLRLMNSTWFGAAVVVLALVVLANNADADWSTETINEQTVATLHGVIQAADTDVPEADMYFIHTGGGSVQAGYKIAETLNAAKAYVTYGVAASAGAWIAVATNAIPASAENSRLGFHWTAMPEGWVQTPASHAAMEFANSKILVQVSTNFKSTLASKIIAGLSSIKDLNQGASMVWVSTTGEITITKPEVK
jgi:ATP-dependent protease ClpP protease subunit